MQFDPDQSTEYDLLDLKINRMHTRRSLNTSSTIEEISLISWLACDADSKKRTDKKLKRTKRCTEETNFNML